MATCFPRVTVSFSTISDSPIADNIQQMFLDDLLTCYQQMETSFTKHLYMFYKGFEFRSLWDVDDRLTNFQRTATEAAPGTGQLQGVLQLNNALNEIDTIQSQGQQCFTRFRYSTNVNKWSFDTVQHEAVCKCMHAYNFAGIHASCMHLCVRVSENAIVLWLKEPFTPSRERNNVVMIFIRV